ncbi:MAG: cation diffusion facilitator family transporter, partial [Bacteroidales bacterium]|nr:cation diffusion facilitator family transporter [Bacteroidales bacterium]
MSDEKRIAILKRASWVSITGNTILAIFKLVAGFVSGSLSVVADGIDSSGDVLISGITLYIATLLAKPPNIKFPYGYGKVETNATNAISFIIFFAGAQLALSSIKRLFTGETGELPGQVAMVAIVASIIGKLGLAWYQMHTGKKIKSNMLIANGKNMQGDVLISTSV